MNKTNHTDPAWPLEIHTEILPRLWQGGTANEDTFNQLREPQITKQQFDSVYTLYAFANPVDWMVREVRLGFYDDYEALSIDSGELYRLARMAHRDWKRGERVLIRCQAGLNRSGLIMGLTLLKEGYSAEQAIELMRAKRASHVLMNPLFESWLMAHDHQTLLFSSAA